MNTNHMDSNQMQEQEIDLIELFYKVREKMEEGSIEVLVQFFQVSIEHIS